MVLFLLFIIIITKRNFRPFLSIISFLYHNDHIEMIEILWLNVHCWLSPIFQCL